MKQSPQEQIERIIKGLLQKKPAVAPFVETLELAKSSPEAISDLALAVMRRFPKGGAFLNAALSYLPDRDWPNLVEHALNCLETAASRNHAAESVIEYAGLQAPTSLHPHLGRIFAVRANAGSDYEFYPWRESEDQHFDFLRAVLEDPTSGVDDKKRAWRAMLQTRFPRMVEFAVAHSDFLESPDARTHSEWVQTNLHLVGLHLVDLHSGGRIIRRTCPASLFHVRFPDTFFDGQSRLPWLARVHPTWNLPADDMGFTFGGRSEANCHVCQGGLHRLIVLDPIPPGLNVTALARLEIATCLSCLGCERQPLFYQHDSNGKPTNVGYEGPVVEPECPVGPLKSATVRLAETPRRWFWQEWGASSGRENLNRLGGEPSWIQDVEYPRCPSCQTVMAFLMQLDSGFPTEHDGEWLWGSGGIGYTFWCDACKVSSLHWQCT